MERYLIFRLGLFRNSREESSSVANGYATRSPAGGASQGGGVARCASRVSKLEVTLHGAANTLYS